MYPRIVIAGTNSSCGKTTITLAVLQALKNRGINTAAFKCGPDFIDPMFHKKILGLPSYNLDMYMCEKEIMQGLFCDESRGRDISIIEGVMGYYDGTGKAALGSTYDIAGALSAPVVLVINARGMLSSAGAVISGFKNYKPNSNIKGVIFNRATQRSYAALKNIAEDCEVAPLGFLPERAEYNFESRHLGLITADEITGIEKKMELLGAEAEEHIDINSLLDIAAEAESIEYNSFFPEKLPGKKSPVLAVAKDEAFCFIYEENLEILKKLGCRIVFFSPLHDKAIPTDADGLYLPGGYPELYKEALSSNKTMLRSIKTAIEGKLPCIAECGGFMYLHLSIDKVSMCGVINADAFRTSSLQRFGYAEMAALKDNMLCSKGEKIKVHEFHYYESSNSGEDFLSVKASDNKETLCIHATENMYAGFPHLYFPANINFAENFVKRMQKKQ